MNDITILYYTSNRISDGFASNVRYHLWKHASRKCIPIISISQKPIDFGQNICVGEIGANFFNVYKQIFEGVKVAKTKYVACCEDDTLYVWEHFMFQPSDDAVAYNMNKYHLDNRGMYIHRERTSMLGCVASTNALYKTLDERFNKYPEMPQLETLSSKQRKGLAEPGRFEHLLGLPVVKLERFNTEHPIISFNHGGIGGMRSAIGIRKLELAHWGDPKELWRRFYVH